MRTILDVIPMDLWGVTLRYLPPCAEKYVLGIPTGLSIDEVVQWGNIPWCAIFELMNRSDLVQVAPLLGMYGNIRDIKESILLCLNIDEGMSNDALDDILRGIITASRVGTLRRMLQLQDDPELHSTLSSYKVWGRAVSIFLTSEASDRVHDIFDVLELDTRPISDIDDRECPLCHCDDVLIERLLNSNANRSDVALHIAYSLSNNGVYEWLVPLFKRLDHDILRVIAKAFHYTEPRFMLEEVLAELDNNRCTSFAAAIRDTVPQ